MREKQADGRAAGMMDNSATSSPTSFSSAGSNNSERERESSNSTSLGSLNSPVSGGGGSSTNAFTGSKVGSITPTASPISSPWGGLPSARKAIGSGAIGSQRSRVTGMAAGAPSSAGATDLVSPALNAGLAGSDWFGGRQANGSSVPLSATTSSGEKGYPGLGRTDSLDGNSFGSHLQHPGLPSRTASTSSVIGGERRHANASSSNSTVGSRPASPTVSITSPLQSAVASPASFFGPPSAVSVKGAPPGLKAINGSDTSDQYQQQQNTPQAQQSGLPSATSGTGSQNSSASGSSAANGTNSTSQELESAFDGMLRGSSAFQEIMNRMGNLEAQVSQLLAHSLIHAGTPGLSGPPFDSTPTRSPSVASSSVAGTFLTAPNAPASRPHSLLLPNSNHNHSASPSIVSTALHSPSSTSAPASSVAFDSSATTLPNASTTSVDREVIRQLTAQLSALGNNVAHLMAAQQNNGGAQNNMGHQGPVTPSIQGLPSAAGWQFDGPPQHPGQGGLHGHHGPPHALSGRPNLANHRSTSYDVPRGAALPRGSAAAHAGPGGYGDERGSHGHDSRNKRSQMTLQAPTPLGMGSRRHSADIIEGMHAAADNMQGPNASGPGAGGAGLGSQSLLGKWEALGVAGDLLRAIVKYGIGPPSKIQMKAIPCVLNTQDIVAQASSIQERIQCYVIPALQTVYNNLHNHGLSSMSDSGELPAPPQGVQALILTATIDQAGQAHRMCLGLGQSLGISSSLIVGQGDVTNELASLTANPPHILVGTPQKLLDLLAIRSVQVDNLSLFIIDEMDQLIARNLSDYVNNLARLLPPPISSGGNRSASATGGQTSFNQQSTPSKGHERQTAIFSCTVPQEVLNFASALQLREPVRVLVRRETAQNHSNNNNNHHNADSSNASATTNVRGIKHFFLYLAMGNGATTPGRGPNQRSELFAQAKEWKLEALADLCSDADFAQAVVYCSSIDAVEAVSYKLVSRGIDAMALHGDMGPSARHGIVSKFRSGNRQNGQQGIKRVLVVYDALCRTLNDIHQVAMVVNYDLPRAVEDYVHRVSCSAASGYGRNGTSVNIVSSAQDIDMLRAIEAHYRLKIHELPPSLQSIA